MKQVLFQSSRIVSVEHKVASGSISSRIKMVATLKPETAKVLNSLWLLSDGAGYDSVDLDFEMLDVRVKFDVDKLNQPLDLCSPRANKFKVFRHGEGEARRLMVSFQVHHSGSPFQLIEYLLRVGGAEGTCTLIPQQADLFAAESQKPRETAYRKANPQ